MTSQQAARELAGLGFHVVKLKPGTKQPAGGKGWQDRVAKSPDAIRWAGKFNVGVMGGSPIRPDEKLLVMDVDNKPTKDGRTGFDGLRALKDGFTDLPRTATVLTPNDGLHLYFSVPIDTPLAGISRLMAKADFPGIDLIGDGLFVVAPPSTLPNGQYAWDVYPQEDISDAPSWLLGFLRLGGRAKSSGAQEDTFRGLREDRKTRISVAKDSLPSEELDCLVQEIIRKFCVEELGQRNDRMHKAVASLMGRGIFAKDVEIIMTRWHEHFAPVFSTGLDEAFALMGACIDSTVKKISKGEFTTCQTDHLKILKEWKLTPRQKGFLQDLESGKPSSPHKDAPPSVLPQLAGCHSLLVRDDNSNIPVIKILSLQELRFIDCLIVMCSYEMHKQAQNGGTIPMTNQQIQELLQVRHGLDLDSQQLNRLRRKFITRDKPATIQELLVMEVEGQRRIPSQYRLTGLATAFED